MGKTTVEVRLICLFLIQQQHSWTFMERVKEIERIQEHQRLRQFAEQLNPIQVFLFFFFFLFPLSSDSLSNPDKKIIACPLPPKQVVQNLFTFGNLF
jgi:hypothetical protein